MICILNSQTCAQDYGYSMVYNYGLSKLVDMALEI